MEARQISYGWSSDSCNLFDGTYIGFRGRTVFSVNINIDEL